MVAVQRSLLGGDVPAVAGTAPFSRVELDDRSWIDLARGWLDGADALLEELIESVQWHQGRREMYGRVLDDPRLSHWYPAGAELPHPVFAEIQSALETRYDVALGTVGLNYYRDGGDSVAPHRDRELRTLDADALVAIVTLGAQRPFLVRPHGGGRSRDLSPASGDLLVMGGRTQIDWEHGVPKVACAGPRISCTWRWSPTP